MGAGARAARMVNAGSEPVSAVSKPLGAVIGRRVLSGVVFLVLFVPMVKYAPVWVFDLFVVLLVAVGQWELYRMFRRQGVSVYSGVGMIAGALVTTSFLGPQATSPILFVALVGVCAWAVARSMREGPAWGPIAVTLFGLVYVSWFLGHAISLRALPDGVDWVFLLVWITWVGESAAYFVGSTIGRIRLSPLVSPAKTVEGAVAQLIASPVAALVAHYWFFQSLPMLHAVMIGLLLGTIGQVGDLMESVLKRSTQTKDTGGLIPGHGGLLDRLDSLLFNTPTLFYYARLWSP
jgi:phosphatidate cytidylyltransferase